MKKTFIIALLALAALAGQAQEIRTIEPTLNDYLPLLKAQGYMVYGFDTKDFNGAQAEPVVMEYIKGEEPDLSSDIVKSIPHFYVLGIRIK